MSKSNLSSEDKSRLLQSALSPSPIGREQPTLSNAWIQDVWDDKFVYNLNDMYYQVKYNIDSEGNVKLGEPIEVIRQTIYKPVDSKKKYPFIGK